MKMSITDRLKGLWNAGKCLVGGAALAGSLFGVTSTVNAEDAPTGQETEVIINKPEDEKPKVLYRDPKKVEEDIHSIARSVCKEVKIGDFDSDAPDDIKRSIRARVTTAIGEEYLHYNIDLDEIIEEEYDAAKPGMIRQFLHDSDKFFSDERDFSGDIIGFVSNYHKDIPSVNAYDHDDIEDYEQALYFRHIGDEDFAFFLKGGYVSEEDQNGGSDGYLYGDGLFTLIGEADRTYIRFSPLLQLGPHFNSGCGKIEVGTAETGKTRTIGYLFGGFTRSDDYFLFVDPWQSQPSTELSVEVDRRRIVKQGEVAFEFRGGEKKENAKKTSNNLLYRICAFLYYREEERLYDYRKDYSGTTNVSRYRYDWDFFERELSARLAFIIEPESPHNIYFNITGYYTKLDTREVFDNPFASPSAHFDEKGTIENGTGRAVLMFPWVFMDKERGTVPKSKIVIGGENYNHYGFIGLLLESYSSNRSIRAVEKDEEVMRPEYYAKRNRYFKETLEGEGNLFEIVFGYHSTDKKDGEKDRLYLFGRLGWAFDFKNFVVSGNISYYHDINTQNQPFDLHAEIQLQFRTSNSHNVWGLGAEFDLESEKFDDPKEREMWANAYLFWSF